MNIVKIKKYPILSKPMPTVVLIINILLSFIDVTLNIYFSFFSWAKDNLHLFVIKETFYAFYQF